MNAKLRRSTDCATFRRASRSQSRRPCRGRGRGSHPRVAVLVDGPCVLKRSFLRFGQSDDRERAEPDVAWLAVDAEPLAPCVALRGILRRTEQRRLPRRPATVSFPQQFSACAVRHYRHPSVRIVPGWIQRVAPLPMHTAPHHRHRVAPGQSTEYFW